MLTADKARLLHVCRANPNAFIEYVCGLKQSAIHTELQGALSDFDDVGIKFPRGHGKTTQVGGRLSWEIGHDPETLISVVQATDEDAVNFTRATKEIIESERYREVFPEIEPDKRLWGAESFKVKRSSIGVKDPTMSAQPIFGNAGKRTKILVFDDIANLDNSVRQPAKREQVKEAYRNTWLPTLVKGARCWRVWTPWHVDDVGALWDADPTIKKLAFPCIGTSSSPWSEMFSPERLQKLKLQMGPTAYARAYNLIPLSAEEQVFYPDSIKAAMYDYSTYLVDEQRESLYMSRGAKVFVVADFAFTEDNIVSKNKSEPDWSVILVGYVMPNGHCYVIDIWRRREKFTEVLLQLYQICRMHKGCTLVVEEVGAMKGINTIIESQVSCPVIKLKRNQDKYARALEQQTIVEQGRFHLPRNSAGTDVHERFTDVFKEMSEFPFSKNDDCTDCAIDLMSRCGREYSGEEIVVSNNPNALDPFLVASHFQENTPDRDPNAPDLRYDDPESVAVWMQEQGLI